MIFEEESKEQKLSAVRQGTMISYKGVQKKLQGTVVGASVNFVGKCQFNKSTLIIPYHDKKQMLEDSLSPRFMTFLIY